MGKKYDYDFKSLKSKVGIDDVALSLGYKIDRRAGVHKYIELVLCGSDGNESDRIIVSHPGDKSRQSYFRRRSQGGGDVLDFVAENLGQFNVTGRNKWDAIAKVLARFANEPLPDRDKDYLQAINRPHNFDIAQYDIRPLSITVSESVMPLPSGYVSMTISEVDLRTAMSFFKSRCIRESTVRDFAHNIHLVHDKRLSYPNFNLGFPYTEPGKSRCAGYEIRGMGAFKSKALGTNSTTAAWIVPNPGGQETDLNPNQVDAVFFAESAYDIMSFYQANIQKLYSPMAEKQRSMVFVSIGGTFSPAQIKNIMEYYPNAKAVDCFDNDIAGRIYGIRMVSVIENLALRIQQVPEGIEIDYKGKKHLLPMTSNLNELKKFISLKLDYGVWKPPKEFKDWNDVVMNRPMIDIRKSSKYERNDHLRESRKGGIKL